MDKAAGIPQFRRDLVYRAPLCAQTGNPRGIHADTWPSKNLRKRFRSGVTRLFIAGVHILQRALKTLVPELLANQESIYVLFYHSHCQRVFEHMGMPQRLVFDPGGFADCTEEFENSYAV